MKILLHGCNGRMGQVITRLVAESHMRQEFSDAEPSVGYRESTAPSLEIVCGVDLNPQKSENTYPVYASLSKTPADVQVDIVIDFSHHSAIEALLDFGISRRIPLVICTTGFTGQEQQMISRASEKIPVFMSANMALGINVLLSLVSQAARVLGSLFDIEIVEKHHNQKVDSPSGTAIMIADTINASLNNSMDYVYGRYGRDANVSKRKKNEIGIHAVRGGAIVGEHNVIFAGQGEVIEIKHSALSRDVFAHGTIQAAKFLAGKSPGLYSMKDVVESKDAS